MAELIAQGHKLDDRPWRRRIPEDQVLVLGREGAGAWAVPWETFMSRQHAELTWRNGHLEVKKLPEARNPIFFRGKEETIFQVKPGEHFVIGETTFALADDPASTVAEENPLLQEKTFSAQELREAQFRDAPGRMDVLNKLPAVISGAADEGELYERLVQMLRAGIPRSDVTALVNVENAGQPEASIRVLEWVRRLETAGQFKPSRRLIQEAVLKQHKTVLHVSAGGAEGSPTFTMGDNFDWAFCTPVPGESGKGLGIYVAGTFTGTDATATLSHWQETDLRDDLKFAELVAEIFSALRQVRLLQRQQASYSQFFSPNVLRMLADDGEEALNPKETVVTVLFCDLRGFSRDAEKHAKSLLVLLERVSKALGIMTQNILDNGGTLGDFHGDAAMGFWGWPLPEKEGVEKACLAALGIRAFFESIPRQREHLLTDFQVGIGMATGTAVAGKIGAVDQFKVTVFGPVVNLASRLEGMTKILRAPILMDEVTAKLVKEQVRPDLARCRRVAHVKPYGLDNPVMATELLPPLSEYPELTDQHLADYEAAVDAWLAGQWPRAYDLLRRMPPEDRVQDFLTVQIAKYDRKPPSGWAGYIELESKS